MIFKVTLNVLVVVKYVTSADLIRSDEELQFIVRHLFVGDHPVCALIAS